MGDAIRILAPAAMPVSLAELKAQTRILSEDEDALMAGYLRAAVEHVEQYTGLGLIEQTWTQAFATFSDPMILRRRPLLSVVSVAYLDAAGATQALDDAEYSVAGVGADKSPGTVRRASGGTWPTALDVEEAVTVTYQVGFGETHNDVPELIRHAILLTAATWFIYREDLSSERVSEVPGASKALLRDWRPLAVA